MCENPHWKSASVNYDSIHFSPDFEETRADQWNKKGYLYIGHLAVADNPESEKSVEPRFYIHGLYKPPIFGSLKYDPIRRDFAEPKPFYNISSTIGDIKNITEGSTVITTSDDYAFRKHVSTLPPSLGLWDRAKLLLSNISHTSRPFDYRASNAV